MVDVADEVLRRSTRLSPGGTTRVITQRKRKKSDTDKQNKGGVKKTRTNVVAGARRSLDMAATTNTNKTALAQRNNAATLSASVTTMKTTNIRTVSKGGAKQAANPATTTKTNNTAGAVETVRNKKKSRKGKKQVVKSVQVDEDDYDEDDVDDDEDEHEDDEVNSSDDGDGDNNNDDDDDDDDDDGDEDDSSTSGSGDGSSSGKGKLSSAEAKFRDVAEEVDEDDDEYDDDDDDDDDAAGRKGNGPTSKSSAVLNMDGVTKVRGMSSKESSQMVQKHVAFRVRLYVQNDLFRHVKFINNDRMLQTAMKLVMDHEGVPENVRLKFHMLYESTFNVALNQKRSNCEQAGGKLVRKKMEQMKKNGEELYTIEELCKLRRSGNEREQMAFYWFMSSFLECVCGANPWRSLRHKQLVSKAIDPTTQEHVVTPSDEAFGLILFENYIDKWKLIANKAEAEKGLEEVAAGLEDDEAAQAQPKKKPNNKIYGKYTKVRSGNCKYGGWTYEGTARFNELYKMVLADRACSFADQTERQLLAHCKAQALKAKGKAAAALVDGDEGNETFQEPLEAMWGLGGGR
jgi:hypothetical protein